MEKANHPFQNFPRGVVTLATTVVIFFTALALAVSIQFLGVGELLIGFQEGQSERAFELADSCSHEAMLRLKRSSSYTGSTLSVGDDSCTITVSGSGGTRTIDVSATVGSAVRKLTIDVSLAGNVVTIDDWDEVTN